jgi:acetate kinase
MKPETQRLYQDINKAYSKLTQVRAYGVQKFSNEYIFHKLAHDFYKSPKTIENIVFNRIEYITSQLSLFSKS